MRANTPSPIVEIGREHPYRAPVERLIHTAFARRYNAIISGLPDQLFALFGAEPTPLAACGVRTADTGFFAECYLDQPMERQVSQVCGTMIDRDRIVEITSLAGRDARSVRTLIIEIIECMESRGEAVAVFTTTPILMHMIGRMGVPVLHLHEVQRARVANAGDWGSYFDDRPTGYAVPSRRTVRLAASSHTFNQMFMSGRHSGAAQHA